MSRKKRVYIVGTHGVPARYGGFETLAEMLCRNLGQDFDITVYCNARLYPEKAPEFFNAMLIYVPVDASGFSGIVYDLITYIHALAKSDVILYLSPVGSGFMTPLKIFTRKKVIVNHGGLNEWEREKLNFLKKRWAKFNHRVASRFADVNIADNTIYAKSLKENFNAESVVIKYGGDHVNHVGRDDKALLAKYPFVNEKYAASVSRAQVDNNLHIVLEAFEKFSDYKLVLVSNWNVSDYGKKLWEKYQNHRNIILLDAIYNQAELDFIRGNAYVYIHSHSRCGTAPSLVEAMYLKCPVLSYDAPANRETTQDKAVFFSDTEKLVKILSSTNEKELDKISSELYALALKEYKWEKISQDYASLFNS
jgi:glycosyltransferase involved in cell wall biosynthesis